MTTGFFTADGEPALALEVRGLEGSRSVEAVIDTGYNGGLTLPPDWIEAMGLREFGEENVILADGRLRIGRGLAVPPDAEGRRGRERKNGATGRAGPWPLPRGSQFKVSHSGSYKRYSAIRVLR